MKKRRSVKLPQDVVTTLAGLWEGQRPGDSIGAILRLLVSCPSAALDLASPGSPQGSWSPRDAEPTRISVRLEESEWASLLDLLEPLGVADAAQAAKVAATLLARRPASLRALVGAPDAPASARANTTPGARANTRRAARAPLGARANTTPGAQPRTTWRASERHPTGEAGDTSAPDLRLDEEEEEDLLPPALGRDSAEVWREGCRLLGPRGPRAFHAPSSFEVAAMALTIETTEANADPEKRRGYGLRVWESARTDLDRVRAWIRRRASGAIEERQAAGRRQEARAKRERLEELRAAARTEVGAWPPARRAEEARRLGVASVLAEALARPGENEIAVDELVAALVAENTAPLP